MPWDTPDYEELAATIEAAFAAQGSEVTDLRTGAVVTSILRAVAMTGQELTEDLILRLDDAMRNAARRGFGFNASNGVKATGEITINFTTTLAGSLTFLASTMFAVPGTNLRFLSVGTVVAPIGTSSIKVPVQAERAGKIYNVPAGSISQSLSSIANLTSVTNESPIITGADPETEAEVVDRFRRAISLNHRGTKDGLEAGIANVAVNDTFGNPLERVGRISFIEGIGQGTVVIDGTSAVASSDLVAACQQAVDGYTVGGSVVPGLKGAGVPITVVAAERLVVPVHVRIRIRQGYTFAMARPLVVQAITREFARLNIGEALIINRIRRSVAALAEIDDFTIEAPTINIPDQETQVLTVAVFEGSDSLTDPESTQSWVGLS